MEVGRSGMQFHHRRYQRRAYGLCDGMRFFLNRIRERERERDGGRGVVVVEEEEEEEVEVARGGAGKEKRKRKKKYGVLMCAEEEPEYVREAHGGYFKMFVRLLGDEGETWHLFRAARGELPTAADAAAFDGFVVTGSCSDAHGPDPWIAHLAHLLQTLAAARTTILLGFCFGHQILSRALGGKTGRAVNGWDIGVTCIHPSNSTLKLLSSLHIPSHLPVIECHRDEVWELPPNAEVMARSEKTGIEMFRYGDHVMGIQGHPEYTKDILLHLIDRLLQRNLIQMSHAEDAKASLEAREPDREAWQRLCKSFLKGKLPQLKPLPIEDE
uniref:Glutamine amidotransferase domain-containing protein n=1 Tax=Ananas comosus var. bracteatus TaxID=296719 RepID=A0A6V7QFF1_ANACO|nr:unnamed protein product [Ananas comosus var. bracteatus]